MSEKILIIDDDLDTLRLVGLMLQRQGYQISAATNGQQGLEKAFEEDPDLIYADIHEDGRFLYPGTGADYECGKGAGEGLKLNIPMQPGWGDKEFLRAWERVAIVSDLDWVQHVASLFGWMMPGEFRRFGRERLPDAIAWAAGGAR